MNLFFIAICRRGLPPWSSTRGRVCLCGRRKEAAFRPGCECAFLRDACELFIVPISKGTGYMCELAASKRKAGCGLNRDLHKNETVFTWWTEGQGKSWGRRWTQEGFLSVFWIAHKGPMCVCGGSGGVLWYFGDSWRTSLKMPKKTWKMDGFGWFCLFCFILLEFSLSSTYLCTHTLQTMILYNFESLKNF